MCKKTKIWLVLATLLVLFGLLIFSFSMINLEWNFSKLDKSEYERNIYTFEEKIKDIYIETTTPDITFLPSGNGEIKIECYEEKNEKHRVEIVDGVLNIQLINEKKWYEYIGIFNFKTPKITVYIPCGNYGDLFVLADTGDVCIPNDFSFSDVDIRLDTGDMEFFADVYDLLKLQTSTGDIFTENISAENISFSVSTGHISARSIICKNMDIKISTGKTKLENISCQNFTTDGSTGDVFLEKVLCEEKLYINRSTGDIRFNSCNAGSICAITDTGDITGTLLSSKIFDVETDTGKVIIPKTYSGGLCQITTSTGDIKIKILE